MKKKNLPLLVLQALNRINARLTKLAGEHSDLVEIGYKQDKFVLIQDTESDSLFEFELLGIELTKTGVRVEIAMTPGSTRTTEREVSYTSEKGVLINFENWLSWLKVYDRSHLTPEDRMFEEYKQEFYADFEIVDADADTAPFTAEKQIALDTYLGSLSNILENESHTNDKLKPLIGEIEEIRRKLGQETKKKVITRLSTLFAKIRKTSVKVLGEIYDIGKKEGIKRLFNEGFDAISQML